MPRVQWGVLTVVATVGAACAHVPPRAKPDKRQPLVLVTGGKVDNWQTPPRRQRTRPILPPWPSSFGRPSVQGLEQVTPAGNPVSSMESPLRQLLQPVPVVDAPLPLPSAPSQGRP